MERTRDSAQSRQSKQSYGSMTSEQRTSLPSNLSAASDHGSLASLASAMWDETGMRFREKAVGLELRKGGEGSVFCEVQVLLLLLLLSLLLLGYIYIYIFDLQPATSL